MKQRLYFHQFPGILYGCLAGLLAAYHAGNGKHTLVLLKHFYFGREPSAFIRFLKYIEMPGTSCRYLWLMSNAYNLVISGKIAEQYAHLPGRLAGDAGVHLLKYKCRQMQGFGDKRFNAQRDTAHFPA